MEIKKTHWEYDKKDKNDSFKEEKEDIKVDKIQDYQFKHGDFASISETFWKYMKSGCDQNNNIVAQMSAVSVVSYIDKQGITTENQKYVDELVVFNEKEEREVLDLMHKDNQTEN